MIERKIKELTIALEALSRINGYAFETMSRDIRECVDKHIETLKEDLNTPKPIPAPAPTNNDEIPF